MQNYSTATLTPRQGVKLQHGRIQGDTWIKQVSESRHLLRTPPGWAVDLADLELAESQGARFITIHELEGQQFYHAPLSTLRRFGQRIDRAFGPQLVLPLSHWTVGAQCPDPLAQQPRLAGL